MGVLIKSLIIWYHKTGVMHSFYLKLTCKLNIGNEPEQYSIVLHLGNYLYSHALGNLIFVC